MYMHFFKFTSQLLSCHMSVRRRLFTETNRQTKSVTHHLQKEKDTEEKRGNGRVSLITEAGSKVHRQHGNRSQTSCSSL